ncbi:MAG: hypothetical protein H6742_21025 [Alphaproteobacteria bacterium]|nr:hypothetical protein [Alphaproteobacteria bacterium]
MSELSTLARAEAELAALGPLPFPLPLGPLAPAVAGMVTGMQTGDWLVLGPRERIGAVLRGCPVERLVDPARGARPYKLAPTTGRPGARALHAVGLALGSGRPVLCALGSASIASGALHEALNSAVLTGAPVLFVLLVQQLPDDAPVGRQLAGDVGAIAAAHGVPESSLTCSGDDAAERVRACVQSLREEASKGGPRLLLLTLP